MRTSRLGGRAPVADGLLALLLVAVGVVGTAFAHLPGTRAADAWAFVLVVVAAGSLALRRRWPLAVLAVVTLATSTYLVAGYSYGPILLCFFVATYTVARHLPARTSAPAAAAALVVLLAHLLTGGGPGFWVGLVPGSAWVVVPFALGVAVRLARESQARDRAEVVRRQVHEERMRVAQEVHDVVGHGLAAIKMQADIALHVLPGRPEQAAVALAAISSSSGAALDELRATLSSIREVDDSRLPPAGLARLDDLGERLAQAGLRVRVVGSGTPRTLPPAVDLAAYRVVQESLTNVLRHSESRTATVAVRYDEPSAGCVTVTVTDPGDGLAAPPAAGTGPGTGLAGMRERVEALGGDLSAGPDPDGGWRVRAVLPATGGDR